MDNERGQITHSEMFTKISNAGKSRTNKLKFFFPYFKNENENKWLPLLTGFTLSSNGYTINTTITKHQRTDFKYYINTIQYHILELSNMSIGNIVVGWLNQGMIMFKLLNLKDLFGRMIRLLMIYIEIRFFNNKGKLSVYYSNPNIEHSNKRLALILRIFAYKDSDT